jgi:hypothetical protein
MRQRLKPPHNRLRLRCGAEIPLLGFPMRVMFAAVRAEFFHFKTLGRRLFVLGACVVPVLALLALERDDFSWHCSLPLYFPLIQNL